MSNACTTHCAGSVHSCVGNVGSGSSEVENFSSPSFAYAASLVFPAVSSCGGVTVTFAYLSVDPSNASSAGLLTLQPCGTSTPAETLCACVAYECTRSNTSNGFALLPNTSTVWFGSTISVYAGTIRSGTRSTRVDV